jgi:thioredoxin reductase
MLETAIIGAGPYGLSIAAHFRRHGIPFRIFGRPMDSWRHHMPKSMMLKSDGFASNIYDPDQSFTLRRFCAEQGIEYSDTGIPVRLDTFSAYGQAFQERMLPELENQLVVSVDRVPGGFSLQLESGERIIARRVVVAVGITHFEHVPETLAHLPAEFQSHSFRHRRAEQFRGRSVIVIGGGASAIDLAAELQEAGSQVQLVARRSALKFHSTPTGRPRSRWQRIRHPQSGLGPGLRSRFFSDAPGLFHHLPERFRLEVVERTLGPSAGWFVKAKMDCVPCLLGYSPWGAEIRNGKVHLRLRKVDGTDRELVTEHIISATGYKVDLERLGFLSAGLRLKIKVTGGAPVLTTNFESSIPGLYFAGLTAANSFGPVMRFAFGAKFAARRLTQTMLKALAERPVLLAVSQPSTAAK